jgi:uncharacterized DUF497 family protein
MKITYDPVKRAITLADRGLDFEDAAEVFRDDTLDFPDHRRDYASCASSRSAISADGW